MVEEQLHFILHILGTPTEKTWWGILSKEEFKTHYYPKYPCCCPLEPCTRPCSLGETIHIPDNASIFALK